MLGTRGLVDLGGREGMPTSSESSVGNWKGGELGRDGCGFESRLISIMSSSGSTREFRDRGDEPKRPRYLVMGDEAAIAFSSTG